MFALLTFTLSVLLPSALVVHKTKELPGFEATGTGTQTAGSRAHGTGEREGSKRPQSANATLGSSNGKKRRKTKKKGRGKSATRRRDQVTDMPASENRGDVHALEDSDLGISADTTDKLSQAPSEDEDDAPRRPVPHHRGPAIMDHHMPKRAYLEASMSFRVLSGNLKDLIQLGKKQKSNHGKHSGYRKSLGSRKSSKGSRRRPDSAPAGRSGHRIASHDSGDEASEDEDDVYSRLYKDAQILPKVRILAISPLCAVFYRN